MLLRRNTSTKRLDTTNRPRSHPVHIFFLWRVGARPGRIGLSILGCLGIAPDYDPISTFAEHEKIMQTDRYHDRRDAGALLATELRDYAGPRTVVLGLARGGVPVAAEVAARLGLPLDVMLVRRLVDENDPETSYGAIALGGIVVLQNDVLAELALDDAAVKREVGLQQLALDRAEFTYRGDRAGLLIARRRVILVDDGLRSGSSMWAALEAARARQPTEIIVSAPVGSADAVERLESLADRVVCPRIVADGEPIRSAYSSYPLVTDDEVCALIRGADASSATV